MTIGATIRQLRQEQDITQEQLAEALGITSRAVSQWECDRTAPDISQLPALANFFDVTTDRLLGVDITRRKDEINAILEYDRVNYTSEGNNRGSIDYLSGKLKQYPNSPELFNALAASMYSLYFQSGEIDDDELKKEKAEEIIELCDRGIEYSGKDYTGDHFKQFLVYLHTFLGNKEKAREIACSLPHMHTTRDMLYPRTLEGKEALKAWQELLINIIWSLSFVMGKIKSNGNYAVDEKIEIMNFREQLIRLMAGNESNLFSDLLFDNCLFLSSAYLSVNDYEKSINELEKAVKYADAENKNATTQIKPCWFSEIDTTKTYTVKHNSKERREILTKYFYDKKYITAFKDNQRFERLMEKLKEKISK